MSGANHQYVKGLLLRNFPAGSVGKLNIGSVQNGSYSTDHKNH